VGQRSITGKLGDRRIEQHWSAPPAGSTIAMSRSIQQSRNAVRRRWPTVRMGYLSAVRMFIDGTIPGLPSWLSRVCSSVMGGVVSPPPPRAAARRRLDRRSAIAAGAQILRLGLLSFQAYGPAKLFG